MIFLLLINLFYLEELDTAECCSGVFPPLEDDAVLFDFAILYIFEIVFFNNLSGQFILNEFFSGGLCEWNPSVGIAEPRYLFLLISHS